MPAKKKVGKKKVVKKAVKPVKKRTARKPAVRKPARKETKKELVGHISHFYNKIGVAVVEVSGDLLVGDKISVEGSSTNFTQKIESMQIEHNSIKQARGGDSIGMKVKGRVREGDKVYKLV